MTVQRSAGKGAAFLALHAGPGFVLPNAWDAGSARILEGVGFPAIATTSAGIAWSCGVPDGGAMTRGLGAAGANIEDAAGGALFPIDEAAERITVGVRRISLGGSLARAALTTLEQAATELVESGTLSFLDDSLSYAEVQQRFDR